MYEDELIESSESPEPTEEAAETPAGFPGAERASLDVEDERMARALSALEGASEEEATPAPAPDPEPPAAPEPEAPTPEPEPKPAAAETELLARLAEMNARLEERFGGLEERERTLTERAARIEKFEKFAEKAESEHFLDAITELGWDPDKITKAIVQGRGVRAPQDETKALVDEVRAEMKRELEALRGAQREREEIETNAILAREVSVEDRAPLVAAFGEQGHLLVKQEMESAKSEGQAKVPREQAIRAAVEKVEADLSERFLKVAFAHPGVRKKYAQILGISDSANPVTSGRPLSQRDAGQVARRAETETLTEEARMKRALSHFE